MDHDTARLIKVAFYIVNNAHLEAFCLPCSFQVLPLNVATTCDSYAWSYRELLTVLTWSEILVERGFEPLTIVSMLKNPTTELSWHLNGFLVSLYVGALYRPP